MFTLAKVIGGILLFGACLVAIVVLGYILAGLLCIALVGYLLYEYFTYKPASETEPEVQDTTATD